MENVIQVDVCIVGAGPSGAFLGYLLAKAGVKTCLIERSGGNTPPFRGEHINAETEKMLKENGLFEIVEKKGLLRMSKVEFIQDGHVIKEILPGINEDHVGIHVPQTHLLSTMMDAASEFNNFTLMLNTKAVDLIQDNHGFYCGVKTKKGQEEHLIKCSVVVGADGRYPTIRRLAEIPVETASHGYDVLWAKVPAPYNWEPVIKNMLTNHHQLALYTQTRGFVQIGWNIPKGTYTEIRKTSLNQFVIPLVENIPELRATLKEHLKSWKDIVLLDVFNSKSPSWVKDGLVMIGDAAHTLTPTNAVGINAAMKDAYVLAPIVVDAIRAKDFSKDVLFEFEDIRRAEVELLLTEQIQVEKSYARNFKEYMMI